MDGVNDLITEASGLSKDDISFDHIDDDGSDVETSVVMTGMDDYNTIKRHISRRFTRKELSQVFPTPAQRPSKPKASQHHVHVSEKTVLTISQYTYESFIRSLEDLADNISLLHDDLSHPYRHIISEFPKFLWRNSISSYRKTAVAEMEQKITHLKRFRKAMATAIGIHHEIVSLIKDPTEDPCSQDYGLLLVMWLNKILAAADEKDENSFLQALSTYLPDESALMASNIRLNEELVNLLARLKRFDMNFKLMVAPYKRRSHLRRHWLTYTVATIGVVSSVNFLYVHSKYNNSTDLDQWIDTLKVSLSAFAEEHIIIPAKAIYNELFFSTYQTSTDLEQVRQGKLSYQRMIDDFSEQHVVTAKRELGMKNVMDVYEQQIKHPMFNLFFGNLVQAFLIQIQQVKVDLEEEMLGIEQLLRQNELNLELMATLPAFILLYMLFQLSKTLIYKASRIGEKDKLSPEAQVILQFRNIHRMLILQDVYKMDRQRHESSGYVLFALFKIENLIPQTGIAHRYQDMFFEDIEDLRSTSLSSEQKIATIQRIFNLYLVSKTV